MSVEGISIIKRENFDIEINTSSLQALSFLLFSDLEERQADLEAKHQLVSELDRDYLLLTEEQRLEVKERIRIIKNQRLYISFEAKILLIDLNPLNLIQITDIRKLDPLLTEEEEDKLNCIPQVVTEDFEFTFNFIKTQAIANNITNIVYFFEWYKEHPIDRRESFNKKTAETLNNYKFLAYSLERADLNFVSEYKFYLFTNIYILWNWWSGLSGPIRKLEHNRKEFKRRAFKAIKKVRKHLEELKQEIINFQGHCPPDQAEYFLNLIYDLGWIYWYTQCLQLKAEIVVRDPDCIAN